MESIEVNAQPTDFHNLTFPQMVGGGLVRGMGPRLFQGNLGEGENMMIWARFSRLFVNFKVLFHGPKQKAKFR